MVQDRTLNAAQLPLLPKDEAPDALGMRLPDWQDTLEVQVVFSVEPPPRVLQTRWLETVGSSPALGPVNRVVCHRRVNGEQ